MAARRTIAHLDLDGRIPFGNILQKPRQSMAGLLAGGRPCTFTLLTTLDMVIASESDRLMCATPWVEAVGLCGAGGSVGRRCVWGAVVAVAQRVTSTGDAGLANERRRR
jgi:hypothetical protein